MLAAERLPLDQDFRIQTRRGITFLFLLSPDEGFYLTLRGSIATFRYLDGGKADGSLQKRVDSGTFNYRDHQLTLHSPCLTRDVKLTLKPYLPKSTNSHNRYARFMLTGPEFPFRGYGPVESITNR
ncbi:hypothetical protein JST97_06650 [bacterium]|nr:hypothetical protein [bacterium]